MKWVVERDVMVEVLQDLISIIEKSAIMPITANVKMSIYGNTISLVATDTKLQIKATIPLASDQDLEEGVITTVSAQKLLDSCRVAEDKEIIFNLDESKLTLAFKQGNISLLTQRAIDFPEIQEPKDTSSVLSLPQNVWADLIKSSMYAAAENHHREMLCGVLLEVEESTIRMVATNGHRMSIAETESSQATQGDFKQAILPKKSLQEMQRLVRVDSDELLSLSFQGDSHVSFKLDKNNISFTSNLIDGDYPQYQAVIPQDNQHTLRVNKDALGRAISNAVIIQKSPPRTVEFRMDRDSMQISSSNLEGEVSEMMLDASFDGEEHMEMSFNEEYIQSALKSFKEEFVEIKIGLPNGSVLMNEKSLGVSRSCVVMPLNV